MTYEHDIDTWTAFKALVVTKKNLALQYEEYSTGLQTCYRIWAIDDQDKYTTNILKLGTAPDPSDQKDFEDNHKANCNFAIGVRSYPFATGDFDFQGEGALVTCTKTTTTDIDIVIPSPGMYVDGGEVYAKDAVVGDYIVCQVIDIDNVLGYGANTILKQWINKWYITPDTLINLKTPYAGFIPAGVYMRCKYTSVGTVTDVTTFCNYFFHKAL